MIYTARVVRIGTSYYVIIPSSIKNIVKLQDRDLVDITIKKHNNDIKIKEYTCKICSYDFSSSASEEDVYCPSCGAEHTDNFIELN